MRILPVVEHPGAAVSFPRRPTVVAVLLILILLVCGASRSGLARVDGNGEVDDAALVPAPEPIRPPVRITFVPPELEGRFALGVFNDSNELVRELEAGPGDFDVGLNGYVLEWDGMDAKGVRAPGGAYAIRGLVIGDVGLEGERYEFNDWVARDGVRAESVAIVGVLETGAFKIRVDQKGGIDRNAMVFEDGTLEWSPGFAAPSDDNADANFFPDAAAGESGAVWNISRDGTSSVLREIGVDGKVLRELRSPPGEPQIHEFAVAADGLTLLVHESNESTDRLRMLRRSPTADDFEGDSVGEFSDSRVVDWQIVFERSITDCQRFGIEDGALVAFSDSLPDSARVSGVKNPLDPDAQPFDFVAVSENGRSLIRIDGLAAIPVGTAGEWTRVALVPGAGDSLNFFQGDGVVVEVYRLRSPENIARFDAGEFLLAAPDETVQP